MDDPEVNVFHRPESEIHLYRKCVGIILINQDGLVFAGTRFDGDDNSFQMPQGGIENFEEPLQAALRELQEETGVGKSKVDLISSCDKWMYYDLPKTLSGKLWGGSCKGQMQKWFAFRYKGKDTDININTENPEFALWKWIRFSDLTKLIVHFKLGVYLEIEKVFGNYFS